MGGALYARAGGVSIRPWKGRPALCGLGRLDPAAQASRPMCREELYSEDPEESGFLVNALASHVSGDQPREAMRLMGDHEELLESSYELCFNLACALIDEGKLDEAMARLEEAKRICKEEIIEASPSVAAQRDGSDRTRCVADLCHHSTLVARRRSTATSTTPTEAGA